MRAAATFGIALVLAGAIALAYGGITTNPIDTVNRTDLAELGPIQIEAEEKEAIPLPPILGGLSPVGGIARMAAGTRKR